MKEPQIIWSQAVKEYNPKRACEYYEKNYDLLIGQNSNFSEEKYLGDSGNRVCRFCGKQEPEVTFNDKSHVFPIATGNKFLLSYYECDKCNHFFGDYLEGEFQNFFSFQNNLYRVSGRKGKIPLVQSNDNYNKMKAIDKNSDEKILLISDVAGKEHVKIDNKGNITLSSPDITILPIAIYKCLTKIALTIMPNDELQNFQKTIAWIKNKKHAPIMEKKHLCRYIEFVGSPNVKYPMGFLFRRKDTSKDGPYMIFLYVYANIAIMIEVPCDNIKYSYDIRKIYPLIIGKPIEDIIIDLSNTEKCFVKGWQRTFTNGLKRDLTEETRNPNTEDEYAKLIRKNMPYLK